MREEGGITWRGLVLLIAAFLCVNLGCKEGDVMMILCQTSSGYGRLTIGNVTFVDKVLRCDETDKQNGSEPPSPHLTTT